MNESLFSTSKLLNSDKPSLVLYVEDAYNLGLNDFIQSNFAQIADAYNVQDIDFCYLPLLLQNKDYQEVAYYNRPYLQNEQSPVAIAQIYSKLKQLLAQPFLGVGLVWLETDKETASSAIGCQLIEDKPLMDQFDLFANVIAELSAFGQENMLQDAPAWKRKLDSPNYLQFLSNEEEQVAYSEPLLEDDGELSICYSVDFDPDIQFDNQAYLLAEEIRQRIQQLKESGSIKLIAEIIEEMQAVTNKLSRIFITNDYRIYLKDYKMQEVVMSPLPKSLFILFLHHPEGIIFKQLSNYHDELLSIYRNITLRENIDQAMESIRAMTNPLNNSINEKCSRIRAAFMEVITDDLAKNYYVTGMRGEAKKIILDRSMVEFQNSTVYKPCKSPSCL